MKPEIFTVTANIKANQKRMSVIRRLPSKMARWQKARCYAVAECQRIGFRAKEDDLVEIAVRVTA